MNKMWSIRTIEYYSVVKRNEALTHATAWMNIKNGVLSERNLTQKVTYCVIHFYGTARIGKSRDGKQMGGYQEVGEGAMGSDC